MRLKQGAGFLQQELQQAIPTESVKTSPTSSFIDSINTARHQKLFVI